MRKIKITITIIQDLHGNSIWRKTTSREENSLIINNGGLQRISSDQINKLNNWSILKFVVSHI